MQWFCFVATLIAIVNILPCVVSASEENVANEFAAIYESLSKGLPPSKLENVTTALTEVKTLLQEAKVERENTKNSISEIMTFLQEMKKSQSETKNELQEMKKSQSEMKKEQKNITLSVSDIQSFLQEDKSERDEVISSLVKRSAVTHNITEQNSETLTSVVATLDKMKPKKNCADLRVMGDKLSGVRSLRPGGDFFSSEVVVYCDQETDGGGWTVIQRRSPLPERENFKRSWSEYEAGFGDPSGEYWLGLQHIHALTRSVKMEIRIDLESDKGIKAFAKYSTFHVGDAASIYTLSIAGYSGTAGDAMTVSSDEDHILNGMKFSTYDQDNDLDPGNCAKQWGGGWWLNSCGAANLNAKPTLVHWSPFPGSPWMKKSSMKIRPVKRGF